MVKKPHPALGGLQGGFQPAPPQQFGDEPMSDPLGAALLGRAQAGRTAYKQNEAQTDFGSPLSQSVHAQGPLIDPNWDKFYQAMNERAPGGVKTPSGRGNPMPGLPNAPFSAPSTMWQGGQSSAVSGNMFKAPAPVNYQNNPAIAALKNQANSIVKPKFPGVL